MTTPKVKTKTIKITGCAGCPHVKKIGTFRGNLNFECWHPSKLRTITWPGTKYPNETHGTMVAEDCEYSLEYPTNYFPKWCPI